MNELRVQFLMAYLHELKKIAERPDIKDRINKVLDAIEEEIYKV